MHRMSLSLIACACLSNLLGQGIVEDSAKAGESPRVITTAPSSQEGQRYVSPPSPYAVLKSKAAGGTAAFFVGVGVDLTTSIILISNPPRDTAGLIPYLVIGLAAGVCKIASVPATCVQASRAVDVYRERYGHSPHNPVWGLYGGGWALYGIGSAINLVGSFSNSPETSLIGSAFGLGGGVLWGIACVRSITFINELAGKDAEGGERRGSATWMITPVVGPGGGVGLAMSGKF